eukprot:5686498-Pyramimonas_sp.AAC.1
MVSRVSSALERVPPTLDWASRMLPCCRADDVRGVSMMSLASTGDQSVWRKVPTRCARSKAPTPGGGVLVKGLATLISVRVRKCGWILNGS